MASFISELKRRNVFKVAATYFVVAWLVVEVTATVLPIFEAPEWIVQVITLIIILAFPFALLFSWAYDLTPDGLERTDALHADDSDVAPSPVSRKRSTTRVEYAVIGALFLALVGVLANRYIFQNDYATRRAEALIAENLEIAEELAAENQRLPNSVAVLPFENLSPDIENAYFAAGIHEEILNQLAKIGALNVIARTTMMQYADGDQPINEIADELNVETVMEGSVRYADGRVLITAQLIDPATNVHLWSESYNREFADIFDIQTDVATNIAAALEAEFSIDEQGLVAQLPTESLEAYSLFLRANQASFLEKVRLLGEAIEIDPEFALALGTRAWARAVLLYFAGGEEVGLRSQQEIRAEAEAALRIEPTIGIAHAALGILNTTQWHGAEAVAAFSAALALQPNEPDVLAFFGLSLTVIGETEEALRVGRRAVALDPSNARSHVLLGHSYFFAEDYDAARASYETTWTINPDPIANVLARVRYAFTDIFEDRSAEAIEWLRFLEMAMDEGEDLGTYMRPNIALAYASAGSPQDAQRVFEWLERYSETSTDHVVRADEWVIAYLAIGDYDEALRRADEFVEDDVPGAFSLVSELWLNVYKIPVLDTDPRWLEVRARGGFDQ